MYSLKKCFLALINIQRKVLHVHRYLLLMNGNAVFLELTLLKKLARRAAIAALLAPPTIIDLPTIIDRSGAWIIDRSGDWIIDRSNAWNIDR